MAVTLLFNLSTRIKYIHSKADMKMGPLVIKLEYQHVACQEQHVFHVKTRYLEMGNQNVKFPVSM